MNGERKLRGRNGEREKEGLCPFLSPWEESICGEVVFFLAGRDGEIPLLAGNNKVVD